MTAAGPSPGVEVLVNPNGHDFASRRSIERAVRHVLADAGVAEGELSVTLLGDDDIRELNREYLGRDHPTDVIAFSLGDDPPVLGDVYIGVGEAGRSSEALGVPMEEELVRLAIHGTLHVLGHEHPEGEERLESPMFALQERLLREALEGA